MIFCEHTLYEAMNTHFTQKWRVEGSKKHTTHTLASHAHTHTHIHHLNLHQPNLHRSESLASVWYFPSSSIWTLFKITTQEKKKQKKKSGSWGKPAAAAVLLYFPSRKLLPSPERIDFLPSHHTDCSEQVSTGSAERTHTFARGQFSFSKLCTS